jgi:hypothetical protein
LSPGKNRTKPPQRSHIPHDLGVFEVISPPIALAQSRATNCLVQTLYINICQVRIFALGTFFTASEFLAHSNALFLTKKESPCLKQFSITSSFDPLLRV